MKVIIAGGRDFLDYELLKHKCNFYLSAQIEAGIPVEVVCGNARGADLLGERYAKECGFAIKYFPADWDRYGKRAGYLRNEQMGDYADALLAFWNGSSRGTKHMIDYARDNGLKVRVVRY